MFREKAKALLNTAGVRSCLGAARRARQGLFWRWNYRRLPAPKVVGWVRGGPGAEERIAAELREKGFRTADLRVDAADYRRYVGDADYGRYRYVGGAEKYLEHYVAAKLLEVGPEDVYIDIANGNAPTPDIYRRLYGCTAYRQDLVFAEGVHGDTIGGDAAHMPVADGFATKVGLHCSFEHFEGDSDGAFIREAGRVLRPGGRLCIVPLYLHTEYAIQTDPGVLGPFERAGELFEKEAVLYCARGFGNRHGRFYDVDHLVARVRENLGAMGMTIHIVQNAAEVDPSCYVRFAALFEKP